MLRGIIRKVGVCGSSWTGEYKEIAARPRDFEIITRQDIVPDMVISMTVYDFRVRTIDGNDVSLADYRGKVLLIVNVASRCGFTPQYRGLEEMYERFGKNGFEVLGFPCNQFGKQEPGTEAEIRGFCDLQFGVRFPMFSKVEVNGPNAHPLYEFLKKSRPGFLGTKRIKWNFTKFLVDRAGKPLKRYSPQTRPDAIEKDVQSALGVTA